MKKLWLWSMFLPCMVFSQVDFFTGKPTQEKGVSEVNPPKVIPTVTSKPVAETKDSENSFMLVLGKDILPQYPYPTNVRGYRGRMDWTQVPKLGYNKKEIHTISILKRELRQEKQGEMLFSPAVWHFKAKTWETVFNGAIPYLEDLLFLSDDVRMRMTTRVARKNKQNELGYFQEEGTGQFTPYQTINSPNPQAVSKILLVSVADYQEIKRLQEVFHQEAQKQEVLTDQADDDFLAVQLELPLVPEGLRNGVSIFSEIQSQK